MLNVDRKKCEYIFFYYSNITTITKNFNIFQYNSGYYIPISTMVVAVLDFLHYIHYMLLKLNVDNIPAVDHRSIV